MRNVPKLRFKEFTDELREVKFKDFLNERKNIATDNEELYSLTIEKGVTPKEERYEREFLVNNEKEAYKIVLKNDFVYNPMNIRFGAVAQFIENKNVKVSKYYNIFYCNNCINSYFFEKFIKTKRMFDLYNKLATGSLNEKKRLHFTDFLEIKQPFPSLEEQEKIGDFLLNIDKKISITEEKLNLFKEYKKGIMQKIFNQELRFKDEKGNDYPEWEEKRLGELLEEYNEKTTTNNQYPILSSTAGGIYLQSEYFNKQTASENNIGYKIIPKGYFTYRSMSDTGNFTFNIQERINFGIVSPAYPVFSTKLEKCNKKFLFFYLNNSDFIKEQILVLKEGGTRYALSYSKFIKLFSKLPCLEEQQKIADFLSTIDTKIEKISDELENLKEFKKGLLQQMFV
ncbi:MAG: restriction endonuclease subunit S [Fusobacterium sp.]